MTDRKAQLTDLEKDLDGFCKVSGCKNLSYTCTHCTKHRCCAKNCDEVRLVFDDDDLIYCTKHHGKAMELECKGIYPATIHVKLQGREEVDPHQY